MDEDDEAALLAELDAELGIEPVDPAIHQEQLREQIEQHLKEAKRAKAAGDNPKAIKHLGEKKKLQAELDEHLLMYPPAKIQSAAPKKLAPAQQPKQRVNEAAALAQQIVGSGAQDASDPIELEEKYHDPNNMVSVAVIEWEVKYLDLLLKKYKNSPDEYSFFEFRKESLSFTKETIEGNIQAGVTTPDSYA